VVAEIPYLEELAEAARLCVTPLEALEGEAALPLRKLFQKVMERIGLPASQTGASH